MSSGGRRYPELSFFTFRENSLQKNVLAANRSVNGHGSDQRVRRLFLDQGAGDQSRLAFFFLGEFHIAKVERWNRSAIDPAFIKPIEGFVAFIPHGGR